MGGSSDDRSDGYVNLDGYPLRDALGTWFGTEGGYYDGVSVGNIVAKPEGSSGDMYRWK